ncbi:hypothetical protein T440DRAFT_464044 [Plenodomus tracheiphilus IPT5]|uniref:Uncharacterized protein n=1 Tax=Plenodomus tracheiphilus IPT5 TaxID=1408161 RepID=A0A6A7BJG0_9PLEO|nr:hypothetical protein T440DRAFT_464044 [Plenodomus tracheiphilus IPT5]
MDHDTTTAPHALAADAATKKARRGKRSAESDESKKRRCISSACVPCRKRKSKVRKRDLAGAAFSAGSDQCAG